MTAAHSFASASRQTARPGAFMFSLRVALLAASAMTIGLAASPAFAEEAERDRSI
jgi:hypothetical protein